MPRNIFTSFFLLLIGFAWSAPLLGQPLPAESVALFTDRDVCLSGEILHFSVFLVQEEESEIPLSTTLYVELLDGQGKAVIQQKYRLESGHCHGALEMSSIQPTGVYFLRAYTQLHRNFPPESYATSAITIVNPDDSIIPEPIRGDSAISIRFATGVPLAGISTRLVIKAPEEIRARDSIMIWDDNGNAAATLLAVHGAYCLMDFTAETGRTYIATFRQGGEYWDQKLPDTRSIGLEADIRRLSSQNIRATLFPSAALMGGSPLLITVADQHFRVLSSQQHSLKDDGLEVWIQNASPDARYVFIQEPSGRILAASGLRNTTVDRFSVPDSWPKSAGLRESLSLNLPEAELAGLAVSVRKKIPLPAGFAADLCWANPWMVPFQPLPDTLVELSEVLQQHFLIRNGHRLLKQPEQVWPPESRDLSISGQVTTRSGRPAGGILTMISVVGEEPQIHACRTDSLGVFRMPLRNLTGTETVFVGLEEPEDQDLSLVVWQDFSQEVPPMRPVALRYEEAFHLEVEEMLVASQVMNRFERVPEREIVPPKPVAALPVNLGQPDVTINVNDFIELPTTVEVFQNIVPKVTVQGPEGQRNLTVYEDRSLRISQNPLILLDYAAVFDVEALLDLPPRKLKRVDVYQGSYHLGDEHFDGIISIFTHTDDFARYPFDRFGAFVSYGTLQLPISVNAAAYPEAARSPHLPDFRQVLYWNPAGTSPAQLQTGDVPGTYEIRVGGLTADGQKVEEVQMVEVGNPKG